MHFLFRRAESRGGMILWNKGRVRVLVQLARKLDPVSILVPGRLHSENESWVLLGPVLFN
jgi:hypothetical protein